MTRTREITYFPYSKNLTHPADRRRFKVWIDRFQIKVNFGTPGPDDLLVLTGAASLRKWTQSHTGPTLIDLVDGYLSCEETVIQDFSRNLIRWFYGTSSFRSVLYTNELKSAISSATAVVVSCPEQAERVSRYNKNVFHILDDHSELKVSHNKLSRNSSWQNPIILWEGLGFTLKHLFNLSVQIEKFLLEFDARLLVVTNQSYKAIGGRFGSRNVSKEIKDAFPLAHHKVDLVEWSVENLIECAAKADLAIIPINQRDCFAMSKPENKLLSYWTLGLPVLCSPTPAYSRVIESTVSSSLLVLEENWLNSLSRFFSERETSSSNKFTIDSYLRENHTNQILVDKWDRVLHPLLVMN